MAALCLPTNGSELVIAVMSSACPVVLLRANADYNVTKVSLSQTNHVSINVSPSEKPCAISTSPFSIQSGLRGLFAPLSLGHTGDEHLIAESHHGRGPAPPVAHQPHQRAAPALRR
jgi:hypothetical protein